jgi:hypothetical protein
MNYIVLLFILALLISWITAGMIALHSGSLIGITLFITAVAIASSPLRRML